MAATVTIRVTSETREKLNRISLARGITAGELVEELAGDAEDRALLEAMNRHYGELRAEPEAWQGYLDEVEAWDATAGDGLSRKP
jgi:hypothetical protein